MRSSASKQACVAYGVWAMESGTGADRDHNPSQRSSLQKKKKRLPPRASH